MGHMSLSLSFVEPEHQELTGELLEELEYACELAEKSKAFIELQLDPNAEWRGWPAEVAEAWLETRPSILARYFDGSGATAVEVGRALRKRFRDAYRPSTGRPMGRPVREPIAGLDVPEGVSEALDDATWDAMARMGGRPDLNAIRQAVKIPSPTDDEGEDTKVVILSAGTVTGRALEARYTSIAGDLYWADIRNSLQVWIMARPELIQEFAEWDTKGQPRAWENGGKWVGSGPNDHREHNPIIHIRTSAFKTALKAISRWRNEGLVSLDAILDGGGEESLKDVQRTRPERRQHDAAKQHFAWGLRDDVDCYSFPVVTSLSTGTPP